MKKENNPDEIRLKILEDVTSSKIWIKFSTAIAMVWFTLLVSIINWIYNSLANIELSLNSHKEETMQRVTKVETEINNIKLWMKPNK